MELSKKRISGLIALFTLAYTVSYITRINFGAIISEMESDTGILRSLLSLSITGSFITYGLGQIISGFLGDRISPKNLISIGFLITIAMNVLIPLCKSPYGMLFVWCINGFAQSLMWPPMVKLMAELFSSDDYKRATVWVMYGSSFGTIFVYLVSPLIIMAAGWKAVFLFSAAVGLLMLILWNKFSIDVDVKSIAPKEKTKTGGEKSGLFTPTMIVIMVAIIAMGMLRDGVTTWMPTYVSDTYNMSNIVSILTGVILPIFGMVCFKAASVLYGKAVKNPVFLAGLIFLAGVISSVALYFITGKNAVLSITLMALLTGTMHGVNFLLIGIVPSFFKKSGNVSLASGVINACTYIGSAISTFGVALLSEKLGWDFTLLSWVMIAVLGTVCCFVTFKSFMKKMG